MLTVQPSRVDTDSSSCRLLFPTTQAWSPVPCLLPAPSLTPIVPIATFMVLCCLPTCPFLSTMVTATQLCFPSQLIHLLSNLKFRESYHFLFQNVRQLSSAWWKIIDEMLATSCPRSTHYSQLMQAPGHLSLHRSSGAALLTAYPHTAMTFKIPRQHSPHTLFLQG